MENCHLGNYNLLFEHSSPVILQLINAVLNVTKGAVSTILPAIERCVQQWFFVSTTYFGAWSYLSGYQRLANSFTVLTYKITNADGPFIFLQDLFVCFFTSTVR